MVGTTPQLELWRGDFGEAYTARNAGNSQSVPARVAMWAAILERMVGNPPTSILEIGSNVGNNLHALRALTGASFYALEPIARAREVLIADGIVDAGHALDGSASSIQLLDGAVDMVFTSGVLIHIHPRDLLKSCTEMYRVSARYVVCIEYFSDNEETVSYRGQDEALFKRDFGGYWMDNFPNLRLLGYGFCWKRVTGLDNLTWWAFEKAP